MYRPTMLCPVVGQDSQPLPASFVVLGNFSGHATLSDWTERQPVAVTEVGIEAAFDAFRPQLQVSIDNPSDTTESIRIDLYFGQLVDFEPERIIERTPLLAAIAEKRKAADGSPASQSYDQALDGALKQILHHPDFRELEAVWHSLIWLVQEANDNEYVVVEALSGTRDEWASELRLRDDVAETTLFQVLGVRIFATDPRPPVNMLVVDGSFSQHPRDVEVLEKLVELGGWVNCTIATGASPKLIGLNAVQDLGSARIEATVEHAKWNSLREMDEARNLWVGFPRIWCRPSHGDRQVSFDGSYIFNEQSVSDEAGNLTSAAYLTAALAIRAFTATGWFGALSDRFFAEESLEVQSVRCSDDRQRELPLEFGVDKGTAAQSMIELGVAPLLHRESDIGVAMNSCYKPKLTSSDEANRFQAMSRQLNCTLSVGRISHCLNRLVLAHSGGHDDNTWCQLLESWLAKHLSSEQPAELNDQGPIAAANVGIQKDRQGNRDAIIELKFWLAEGKLPHPVKIAIPL